jgi:hypothetical protein
MQALQIQNASEHPAFSEKLDKRLTSGVTKLLVFA